MVKTQALFTNFGVTWLNLPPPLSKRVNGTGCSNGNKIFRYLPLPLHYNEVCKMPENNNADHMLGPINHSNSICNQ